MSTQTDRQAKLDRFDTLISEVERLESLAAHHADEEVKLEQQVEYHRGKRNEAYASIRKTNAEIDKLVAELRGRGSR